MSLRIEIEAYRTKISAGLANLPENVQQKMLAESSSPIGFRLGLTEVVPDKHNPRVEVAQQCGQLFDRANEKVMHELGIVYSVQTRFFDKPGLFGVFGARTDPYYILGLPGGVEAGFRLKVGKDQSRSIIFLVKTLVVIPEGSKEEKLYDAQDIIHNLGSSRPMAARLADVRIFLRDVNGAIRGLSIALSHPQAA